MADSKATKGSSPTSDGGLIVIGAGFARTGTLSTKTALEILYPKPCHHMIEVIQKGQQEVWANALAPGGWANGKEGVLALLENYACSIDLPSHVLYKELMKEYPNAKVLLTVRDNFEAWYASIAETVYLVYEMLQSAPAYVKMANPTFQRFEDINAKYWAPHGLFQGRFHDKDFCKKVYEDWIAEVKRTVPAKQLLVFNVKQGWAPLCSFLELPIPKDTPFPHVNETADFQKKLAGFKKVVTLYTYGLPTVAVGVVAAVGALALKLGTLLARSK